MRTAWLSLGFVILAMASCDSPRRSGLGGGGADAGSGADAGGSGGSPAFGLELLAGNIGGSGNGDGTGANARFLFPFGVALDSIGNIYVADRDNQTIRKITPAGVVTTLAGSAGLKDSTDGVGANARFDNPTGVAADDAGNVYVADQLNQTIRKITPAGVAITLAGSAGLEGSADGTGAAARFIQPTGVAVDSAGNLYVTDAGNVTIRKVTAAGVVTTAPALPRGSPSLKVWRSTAPGTSTSPTTTPSARSPLPGS